MLTEKANARLCVSSCTVGCRTQ